jgi:uncharacterized protein YecE (DUF72 family)
MGELLLGCSGWNYGDTPDKGGWVGIFYPDKNTKRLRFYSQFFNTAEMDSIFYEKFYSHMTRGDLHWNGQSYSRKVPIFSKGARDNYT